MLYESRALFGVIEGSKDLRTWLPLQTNSATSYPLNFEDANAANDSYHFYRARQR